MHVQHHHPQRAHPAGRGCGASETLAASMRDAWTSFAESGNPSTAQVQWPSAAEGRHVMSLVPLQPQVETNFATKHHCSFWFAG